MISVDQDSDLLPPHFNNTFYITGKDKVYFMCTSRCEDTKLILQNKTDISLYVHDVCEIEINLLPVKLATPQTTFSISKETLVQQRQEDLNERIVVNADLNFHELDVEEVFKSLDIESILEEHNDWVDQLSDVTQPLLHITYLAAIMLSIIILTVIVVCCRRRRERCYCERLSFRELLCCHCCAVRTRAPRRPAPVRQDYQTSSAHGDYLEPRRSPAPARNTTRRATVRGGSPSGGRYLSVATTTST